MFAFFGMEELLHGLKQNQECTHYSIRVKAESVVSEL